MTLTDQQAREIIKKRPNGKAIELKQAKSEILKAHVTGIGDDKIIETIQNFERKQYGETRKKMRMSNKDIIHRVMQPRNKIYTAKGGIETFTMSNMGLVNDFKLYLSTIRGTQSLKQYIAQNIQPMYDYDPEGLVWLDLNGDYNPYPTFKSIHQIYDYELCGRRPEWVAFSLSAKEIAQLSIMLGDEVSGKLIQPPSAGKKKIHKVFRLVCDARDRIITWDNVGEPVIVSDVPNPFAFMGVPGLIVSDIVGAGNDYEDIVYDSPLQPCVDILNQLMFSRSLFNIAYTKCAYPKEWMTKMPCPTCHGNKMLDDTKCPECGGTGVLPQQLHSDVLIIDYANDGNKSIPHPPMGHTDPAVDALQFMRDNNMSLEDMFDYTMFGVSNVRSTGNTTKAAGHGGNVSNTAYEAQQNEQPRHDRLIEFSNWYSQIKKWYADGCGNFKYGSAYVDSGIIGGKRFMIESADATFDRLLKARTGGATKSELDSLTIEYLENKYQDDPMTYRKFYTLFIAEPFYHDSIADVLTWNIPDINKMEKIFFDEWTATLDENYFAMLPDDELEQRVKDDLRKYTIDRISKDNDSDVLLFTSMGQLVNVGDKVMVKKDKALSTDHVGVKFSISGVNGRYAMLDSGNPEQPKINGYEITDLVKQNV